MKILDCKQIKELEQKAVDSGISYLTLMENAGGAAARFLIKKVSVAGKEVVILCGKGNNGGDGFVIARHLAERGATVTAVMAEGIPCTEIAAEMLRRIQNTTVKIISWTDNQEIVKVTLAKADYVFDAIYGIGFHGSLSENISDLANLLQISHATVIAVDIPSGAQCDNGFVTGKCFKVDYTVTFSSMKPAHVLLPAKEYCGQVSVVPVGIPAQMMEQSLSVLEVTERDYIKPLFQSRKEDTNKGSFGTLLSLCGSEGMAGAAVMSAKAALKCGVGLLNLAIPSSIYQIIAANLMEPVYTLLVNSLSGLPLRNKFKIDLALKKATACLIGCGLGSGSASASLVYELISSIKIPMIVDADGINAIAENIDILKTVSAPLVLTPHPGEMSRLMKTSIADVQANRIPYAKSFAEKYGVIVVLKGSGTVVANPYGSVFLNMTGNPGMAKGGSGDVLAGMIASFIAQGTEPYYAAVCGAYLHGLAGDLCAEKLSQRAMLPTDMIDALPSLFLQFER